MNSDFILKKEGIQIKSTLNSSQVEKISSIITDQICKTFPEHNLSFNDVLSTLTKLNMYIAEMPKDSAAAKYSYKTNSIILLFNLPVFMGSRIFLYRKFV